ncbi:MAG TPA: hypothetical protein VGK25_01515, partial [Ignavibacteria bacterium]
MENFKKTALVFLFFILWFSNAQAKFQGLRYEDKIRIKEALNIFNIYGNKLWEGWNTATFAFLLVTNEEEFLINHPNPGADFKNLGNDSILNTEIYVRSRQFSTNFLATFPAVNGLNTIVAGQPENTGLSSFEWIITLLHEHFHQLQYTRPDYYESVDALDLSGGDRSGMWMLNYPFPYEDDKTAAQYKTLTLAARDAAFSESDFENNFKKYFTEREKFKNLLNEKDYSYFSFQIWQEGIARYTEVKIGEIIKGNYKPSEHLKVLNDYKDTDSFFTLITEKLKR